MKSGGIFCLTMLMTFTMVSCGLTTGSQNTEISSTATVEAIPTVEPRPNLVKNMTTKQLTAGQSVKFTANETTQITWTSSDPYVAKVDETGLVVGGHKGGTTTIMARTDSQTVTCEITNKGSIRDIFASDLVPEMVIGSNFAGSLDWIDWGGHYGYLNNDPNNGKDKMTNYFSNYGLFAPTKKDAADFKAAGYNAIRLPVSFTPFANNKTFEIDPEFLNAVEDGANQFLDQGMFVIIVPQYDYLNTSWVGDHWDEMWMADIYAPYVDKRFEAIWKQLAERFKNYDDHLLFETANEPSISYAAYTKYFGSDKGYDEFVSRRINEMNHIFLNVFRNSGGNNTNRKLLLAIPNSEISKDFLGLTIPNDKNIIITAHYYYHLQDWGEYHSWSSKNPADTKQVDDTFAYIKAFKNTTGIPVIMGEWGNTQEISLDERIDQATYILKQAKALGVPCFWWEFLHRYESEPLNIHFSLYDHWTHTWLEPELLKAIMDVSYNHK